MSEGTSIEAAIKRLQVALDTLEAASERKLESEQREAALTELDGVAARARRLETANRDIAQRLDAAIEAVRSVIAAQHS
jgi:Domain of unknown function (DUF4164)